ncbi:hypothetical protein AAC03nite_11950 [Alicyclobacillus acidoterrestris]|uniref:hypothetical protein n=1 Tax=Alicyclobacillus suci TaxID=2816080 RepID=UPI0011938FFF|nr:hypothetical protein [Alicyclobacillus suci]GEO25410.1 hypothetical protein AAC03nite_11950 [Alicyclobacillus acidoterrestris]
MDTRLLEVHLVQEENKIELRMAYANLPNIRAIIETNKGFALQPPVNGATGQTFDELAPTDEVAQMVRIVRGTYEDSIDGADALIEQIRARYSEDELEIYLI